MKKDRGRDGAGREAPRFRPDMLVIEALDRDPRVKDVLLGFGLPCHRCVVADHETLEQGCVPLGLEVGAVVARLNALGGG